MDKNSTIDFWDAIDKLLIGIKKDYAGWGSDIDSLDESSKFFERNYSDCGSL